MKCGCEQAAVQMVPLPGSNWENLYLSIPLEPLQKSSERITHFFRHLTGAFLVGSPPMGRERSYEE
jgi:hypothetical protein